LKIHLNACDGVLTPAICKLLPMQTEVVFHRRLTILF